jgi:hypothetical protein
MSSRARITFGLALLMVVLAMIIREIHWLAALLMFLGLFLVVWGRLPIETEKMIAQLPGGKIILKGLDQLDMILVPRDHDLEKYLRETIERYDDPKRAALQGVIENSQSSSRWRRVADVQGRWPCRRRFFRSWTYQRRISRPDKKDGNSWVADFFRLGRRAHAS